MPAIVIHFNTDKWRDDPAAARKAVAPALRHLADKMDTGEYVGHFCYPDDTNPILIHHQGQTTVVDDRIYGDVDER